MRRVWQVMAQRQPMGRLGRNTLFATSGLGARALIQAGYLLALSRWLGAAGYGLFAGSVALAILAAPLANWGSALVLTRHVARDRQRARGLWATALRQTGLAGGTLTLVMLLIAAVFVHDRVDLGTMLLLALAELLLLPAAQAATSQCLAIEHGLAAGVSMCLVPAGRLLAALLAIGGGVAGSAEHAALTHFAGSLIGLAAVMLLIARVDGWPLWKARLGLAQSMREGTPYALGGLVGVSYQEMDKVLILQLLGAAVLGPYTAAFRVVSVFLMPVSALIGVSLPRLMAQHNSGTKSRTFRAMAMVALGYAILAGGVVWLAAPYVPLLFGAGYSSSARFAVMFAPWPFLFALHQCAATRLTATDRQSARVVVEGVGMVAIAVLNIMLLGRLGAAASVYSLLTVEAGMAVGCWFIARRG